MADDVFFSLGKLLFSWDRTKAAGNLRKHKISFEEGATVFLDESAIFLDDPDHFWDEVRFVMLGYSAKARLLAVIHIERGLLLRMVSVRPPTSSERNRYEAS